MRVRLFVIVWKEPYVQYRTTLLLLLLLLYILCLYAATCSRRSRANRLETVASFVYNNAVRCDGAQQQERRSRWMDRRWWGKKKKKKKKNVWTSTQSIQQVNASPEKAAAAGGGGGSSFGNGFFRFSALPLPPLDYCYLPTYPLLSARVFLLLRK